LSNIELVDLAERRRRRRRKVIQGLRRRRRKGFDGEGDRRRLGASRGERKGKLLKGLMGAEDNFTYI